jgi:hypothetical protein
MRLPVAVSLALALADIAEAAAPAVVPLTGYLVDDNGVPVDGTVSLDLDLYSSATDTVSLFHERQTDVDVDSGQFTVYVGDVEALDLALFRDTGALHLAVAVNDGAAMSPRFEIGSAPYAAYAQYCDESGSLEGFTATDFALEGGNIGWAQLTDVPADLADGDADTTYDTAALTALLDAEYVQTPNVSCAVDQVLLADGIGGWSCGDVTLDGATIDWAQVGNVPADLADGDKDTTYTAGTGIAITGTAISATPPAWSAITGKPTGGFLETTRVIKGDGGATVALGSISNNGVGETGRISIRAHCNNTIEVQTYNFAEVTYVGATTQWLELPVHTTGGSYQARGNFTVDVFRQNIGSTTDPLWLRIRNKGNNSPGQDCTVYASLSYDAGALPATLTEATSQSTTATAFNATTAPAGGLVTGYYGSYEWNFPVSNGTGWNASTGAGLIVKNNGSVGIGTNAPAQTLDVAGNARASGAVYAGTAFGSTANYGASASTNVVYGQVYATGTVAPGATTPVINLNGLWVSPSNMGTFMILFSSDSAGSNNSYRYGVNVHGLGFNDYTTLASRDDANYQILGSYATLQFRNNSSASARYTVKVLPAIMHDAAHAGL